MKKQLLTLLVMLVAGISGAWADATVETYDFGTWGKTNITYNTYTTVTKAETASFTVNNVDMYNVVSFTGSATSAVWTLESERIAASDGVTYRYPSGKTAVPRLGNEGQSGVKYVSITNLKAGDKVVINGSGFTFFSTNASYYVDGTATQVTKDLAVTDGTTYTMTEAGHLDLYCASRAWASITKLTVTIPEEGAHNYVVKAMAGTTDLGSLAEGTAKEAATYTVSGLKKVIKANGKFYVLNDNNVADFAETFTMGTEDQTQTVSYKEDATIFAAFEAEDIAGSADNATASNGKTGYVAGGKQYTIGTLPAGTYNLKHRYIDASNRGLYIRKVGEAATADPIAAKSNWHSGTEESIYFSLSNATTIALCGYTNTDGKYNQSCTFDYAYIVKTGEYTPVPGEGAELVSNGKFDSNMDYWTNTNTSTEGDANLRIFQYQATDKNVYMWGNWGTMIMQADTVYQTISNLPAGKYEFSADCIASGNQATFAVKAGGVDGKDLYKETFWAGNYVEAEDKTYPVTKAGTVELSEAGSITIAYSIPDGNGSWYTLDNVSLKFVAATIDITAGGNGYTAYNCDYNFTVPEDVKVYKALAPENGVVTMQTVEGIIPANTGVIFKSEGDFQITTTEEVATADMDGNKLVAVKASDDWLDDANYVLMSNGSETKFFKVSNYSPRLSIDQLVGKCYLSVVDGISAKAGLSINWGDDVTAVSNVDANASTSSAQAQGKFVKNGAIVIVKNGVEYNVAGAQVK